MIGNIVSAIEKHRFRYGCEDDLQEGLAEALTASGFRVRREVRLSDRERIDLMVGRVGVEVKVAGRARDVALQCGRYLESDLVDGLVLVTSRGRHTDVSVDGNGKPLIVVPIMGGGL